MHSAIVVIERPENETQWIGFLTTVDAKLVPSLHEQQGVMRPAENVWLVNFQENPGALARLVDAAAQHKLRYGILQLEAAPQWLPASFDPKTIWDRGGA